jgi:CRP-like cAMP-binding protein
MESIKFKNHVLAILSPLSQRRFARLATHVIAEADDVIDLRDGVLFVEEGTVLFTDNEMLAAEFELLSFGPNSFMAIGPLFVGRESTAVTWASKGAIWWISRQGLKRLMDEDGSLARIISNQLLLSFNQLVRQSGCFRKHQIDQRMATMISSTHDSCGNDFMLTQDTMRKRLGASRTLINAAAGALARDGIINYVRGRITVQNKFKLNKSSCTCYQASIDDWANLLIGPEQAIKI